MEPDRGAERASWSEKRSALQWLTQHAAMAHAARCIGHRTAVPSGSEKRRVKSEKWSLREVKSEKCKVKSAARWQGAQCRPCASPIQNS